MMEKTNQNNRIFVKAAILLFLLVLTVTICPAWAQTEEDQVREQLEAAGEEGLLMYFEPGEIMVTTSARRPQSIRRAYACTMGKATGRWLLASNSVWRELHTQLSKRRQKSTPA